ncbi:hypothetical protein B4113_3575 [Geobacillus sp. B4113_201601]|nr:hypothetical protein B4113_3575 [Geobacillus sp. B4113_201601]
MKNEADAIRDFRLKNDAGNVYALEDHSLLKRRKKASLLDQGGT